MARKVLCLVVIGFSLALFGCPPPAPEHITIVNPVDLEAHDISLSTELAPVGILIDLRSSSGRPLKTGTFQAFVTEDIPNVGPQDRDSQGNLIEQPTDITSYFNVFYDLKVASLPSPIELPIGWYFLEAKVRDVLGVEASDLVVFSVDYPGPDFIGSTNSPYNEMKSTVTGVYDECFMGALSAIWGVGDRIDIDNVPTFLAVQAEPLGLPVEVGVPTSLVPSGVLTLTAFVINNAMVFGPTSIGPIDLYYFTGGYVPCEFSFDLSGVIARRGVETSAPRLLIQNAVIADSPSGGTCWVPEPPTECQTVVDFAGEALY
jgi:hypothetical protein